MAAPSPNSERVFEIRPRSFEVNVEPNRDARILGHCPEKFHAQGIGRTMQSSDVDGRGRAVKHADSCPVPELMTALLVVKNI